MAMQLDTGNVPGNMPSGFGIKRVATKEGVEHFAEVLAASTTPPDEHIKTFYADTEDAVMAPALPLRSYVGYVGSDHVAVLEAFNAHGVIIATPWRRWPARGASPMPPLCC